MASKPFDAAEWKKIRRTLSKDPIKYGLPRRAYGSVLAASFNIRKLGALKTSRSKSGRDDFTMRFLADVCRRFDLVAVQEVMPQMTALRRLRELMGPEYGMVVSDIIGTFPGESGNEERLAYIYNRNVVQRGELVTDVSTSRTRVLKTIAQHHKELFDVMDKHPHAKETRKYFADTLPKYLQDLEAGKKVKKPRPPKFKVDIDPFLQFIRTPFAVAFEVKGHPGLERYEFLAVNSHLQFGRPQDRKAEAVALFEWIIGKVVGAEKPNIVLLGDLNFDLNNPKTDLKRIIDTFKSIGGASRAAGKLFVSFPFIFPHPDPPLIHRKDTGKPTVFRTNVGLTQTYDQIGVFSPDERVGKSMETTETGHGENTNWGAPNYPDYGVFNFSDLFSVALKGKKISELTKAEKKALINRYQHKVSDHMPIWFRLPLPADNTGFPTT